MDKITQQLRDYFLSDATLSYRWRKRQLKSLIALLTVEREILQKALADDLAKPPEEAWITEIGFVLHEARYVLSHLRSWMRPKLKLSSLFLFPSVSTLGPQPRGVALIVSPWNYPLQLTLSPLVASIAAGNVTILKPSEYAPATAQALATLIPKYLDEHAFAVVQGEADATQALLRDKPDFVFFTGSTGTARHIARTAADNLTPYVLELGGKSPTVIFNVAPGRMQSVANKIAFAKFTNSGQTCVAPDYVLIQENLREPFIEALKAAVARMFPGEDSRVRIINRRHFDRLDSMIGHGEKIVLGGTSNPETLRIEPTIADLSEMPDFMAHPLMQEEIFGPILPIIPLSSSDPRSEARNQIQRHPTPLAAYIFCDSIRDAKWMHDHILSGNFEHNDALMHVSNIHIPFGGIGESGQGASHGYSGFCAFSHMKGALWNTNAFEIQMRYPPYTPKTSKLMHWLLGD